jgi:hypothetical protein
LCGADPFQLFHRRAVALSDHSLHSSIAPGINMIRIGSILHQFWKQLEASKQCRKRDGRFTGIVRRFCRSKPICYGGRSRDERCNK